MPHMYDAGEAREFLMYRIVNLLRKYGTGNEDIDNQPGWKFSQPTSDTLLIENVEETTMPKLLISVEVGN